MNYYVFTRLITKKEAINQYGKLGFTLHREAVVLEANKLEDAEELLKPYNYKKHIKFTFYTEIPATQENSVEYMPDQIIDLGRVD